MTSMALTDTNSDTPCTTTHIDLQFHYILIAIFNLFRPFLSYTFPFHLFALYPRPGLLLSFSFPYTLSTFLVV